MNISLLPNPVLALILSHLPLADRVRCGNASKLFESVLLHPGHLTILWPPKVMRHLNANDLCFRVVRNVLEQQYGKPRVDAVPFPENHSDESEGIDFFSCGDFLISCSKGHSPSSGELKVWDMRQNPICCTQTIPALGNGKWRRFPVSFTVQGDWVIRTSVNFINYDEASLFTEVWKIDANTGTLNSIFSNNKQIPYPSGDYSVKPIRHNNTLFIPIHMRDEVQVWTIDDMPQLTTIISPDRSTTSKMISLNIRKEILYIGFKQGTIQAVKLNDFSSELVDYSQTKAPSIFRFDAGWQLVGTPHELKLFRQNSEKECYSFPDPHRNHLLCSLSSHHVVMSRLNRCFVFNLWNLIGQSGKENAQCVLPKDLEIIATHVHDGKLIVATKKGKLWRFT